MLLAAAFSSAALLCAAAEAARRPHLIMALADVTPQAVRRSLAIVDEC